ncbi:ligase-associated DNA damage response endonuclease PdeM [Brevundimonas variabilis]|uniref:Calcineurin-like phosphoesterase domain-containing protein n=1 Tax=Brevundimonas variabilis TaxID=74312 RepID=A0A7W9CGJ4_9CAUL|nr:ligase-associated DNA damage response endonuclease PdeM [Brevundimonas variabilis]MBB5745253.1 hypothetical protein [Brevundimonas variabilis]
MNALLQQTLSPTRRACGSLNVRIMGEACVLRCSGALWLPETGTLIAADLHLEKGSAYARRGQMLPPYDSRVTLAKLRAEVEDLRPRQVILLGDSFHDRGSLARLAQADRLEIAALTASCDWIWLTGNHDHEALNGAADPDWPLPGRVVEAMDIGALTLVHEPEAGDRPGEVAGHLHPCATVVAHNRGVRRACFVTDGRRIILPAFGAFTGGLDVRHAAFSGLFAEPPMLAALGRDRVHALAWNSVR